MLDTSNMCLWRNGAQIDLPPKPFAVLRHLVENPNRLVTHDELLDAVWPETYVQPQVLRTYMLDLRRLLGDDAERPRFIQTLPKRGYRFVAPVTDQSDKPAKQDQPADIPARRLVGRDEELFRLQRHAEQFMRGQRAVVLVTGEAGIGKSALADAFCEWAIASFDISVVRGQCVEGFGSKEAHYPVMEALRELCASPVGERACNVLARMAPEWLAMLGREGEASRVALQEPRVGDLCAALEEIAADKPLVLIFEDLHWADDGTLQLISALARRRARASLMVLATYSPRDLSHQVKGLRQDLLMRRLCAEIGLGPLPRSAVGELVRRELRQEAEPAGLTDFVHRHSEGNPLFVLTILEHLIAQRFVERERADDTARWQLRVSFEEMEASVPDGLAQMIELEMERLSPGEQRLLEAGSLMRIAFPAWAVAAALDEDAAAVEEACDEMARRLYFVERAGQDELPDGSRSAFYVFAHGLYREALYQRQTSTRRAQRHVRIATRLGQLFAGREASVAREMALHYECAEDWRLAADTLRSAARHAEQREACTEAGELLEHALQVAGKLSGAERMQAEDEIRAHLLHLCAESGRKA